ncbi:hypothetical protein BGZ54_006810 [Gamsiella multidivaricata]|nr:hypothetical protein BGZ54_006810 [Gamsiella multidivaricata]
MSSQIREREADLVALEVMARAGYDPYSALRYYSMLTKRYGQQRVRNSRRQLQSVARRKFGYSARYNAAVWGFGEDIDDVLEPGDYDLSMGPDYYLWWDSTHPEPWQRYQYLLEALTAARKKSLESEDLGAMPDKQFQSSTDSLEMER